MLGARPRSPEDYLLQEELNPAKRQRVQEPGCPGWLAQPDLQEPSGPSREEPITMVVVPAGYALKLNLEEFDLLLEPTPGSITQVSLPGFGSTIILVPQDLQVLAQPGQPVECCSLQEASLVGTAQEDPRVLQQGSASASGSHVEGCQNASRPAQESQEYFMTPRRHSPAAMVPRLSVPFTETLSPMFESPVPRWPRSPSAPDSAQRYAPWSIWSLRESTLSPLPSSPLQPLPASPPTSLQTQGPQNGQTPPCSPCKTRKRLF